MVADPPYSFPEPSPSRLRPRQPAICRRIASPTAAFGRPFADPQQFLAVPVLNQNPQAVAFPLPQPAATDRPLPINLATALYLSNARPLVIAFAQNSVELAADSSSAR